MSEETGTYICYEPKTFTPAHLVVIERIEAVLAEFKGYTLTVRQMHYQFVARDWMKNDGCTVQTPGPGRRREFKAVCEWCNVTKKVEDQ